MRKQQNHSFQYNLPYESGVARKISIKDTKGIDSKRLEKIVGEFGEFLDKFNSHEQDAILAADVFNAATERGDSYSLTGEGSQSARILLNFVPVTGYEETFVTYHNYWVDEKQKKVLKLRRLQKNREDGNNDFKPFVELSYQEGSIDNSLRLTLSGLQEQFPPQFSVNLKNGECSFNLEKTSIIEFIELWSNILQINLANFQEFLHSKYQGVNKTNNVNFNIVEIDDGQTFISKVREYLVSGKSPDCIQCPSQDIV